MKKIAFLMLPLLASTSLYASPSNTMGNMKQNIKVCVNVEGDPAADGFYAGFVSSDVFNLTRTTDVVTYGYTCIDHTYYFGPKNIKVILQGAYPHTQRFIQIFPDNSCTYMQLQDGEKQFESNFMPTQAQSELWSFYLKQIPAGPGYRYAYQMRCEHTSR